MTSTAIDVSEVAGVPRADDARRHSRPGETVPPKQKDDAAGTDANKVSFPLPLTITLVSLALAGAAGVWRIETRVSVFEKTIAYERELDIQREKNLELRFQSLEAKIVSEGNRSAAMAMAQELSRLQAETKGR